MKITNNINDIINIIKTYIDDDTKLDTVLTAYSYTLEYIKTENDIKDILNTANILVTLYSDIETIIASFLFKLLKYGYQKEIDLIKKFNHEIATIAYGAYKLDKIIYSTENDYLIEYYKKIIVGMTEDVRVIIINLACRLNLMYNIDSFSNDEQKKYAKETLEIIAPIAHHLGIYKIKSELEDLSLKVLKPNIYYDIVRELNSTKTERDNLIKKMTLEVKQILDNHQILNYEIKGRSKSIYSIYNKLDKGRKFSDIYDLFALRIMVTDESLCYLVLGLIHSKFKPISKRFKDFIAMPKSNGYMSLHTTVFGINNELFEIQIRTYEMNEVAENGLAAHWSYKENKSANKLSLTDQKLEFFKTVIDNYQEQIDKTNFYESIKNDSTHGNIYVFTPKGDVIELPKGATPIDFAYKVHTKIGDTMIGAIVNNTIVPLSYILQDNDVIKINTNKNSTPKLSWLKYAKLSQTKNKIKSYFQKERKDEIINYGKITLDKYLKRKHVNLNDFYQDLNIKKILLQLKCKDLNELYLNIGNNRYFPKNIYSIIYPINETHNVKKININKNDKDINVDGIENIKVNIASCCRPIPGDEIIGFITKNNGITVHNINCFNIKDIKERRINVSFKKETKNKYLTKIRIFTNSNSSHLADIIDKLSSNGIVISNVNANIVDSKFIYELSFYVYDILELENIISNIKKYNYVSNIERVII